MNNTHLKKLLTIFLSLMLSVSMLPAGVFAEAANGSEEQDPMVVETVDQESDQEEAPVPEQPMDVGEDSNNTVDVVDEAEKDTGAGPSYDFEMNGEKWVIQGNASANTEDEKTWDAMFADSEFTDNWAEDLVMVARSQVGYKESKKNFAVSENNDRKGYTRYGAWAGEPYADWSPLFVSFCLNYANVDMPYYKEGFDKWITDLEKEKMFADADGYAPRSGDLVFFDNDKDGDVDAAGIVESYDEEKGVIEVIEGDYEDEVAERKVKTSDPTIAGYGILPENPKASTEENAEEPQAQRSLNAKGQTRDGKPEGYDENSPASVYGYERFGNPDNDPRISVEIVKSDDFPETIKAGDTLNYTIRYSYEAIPEINFGYPKGMPLYDKYKNNKAIIELPAGLLLESEGTGLGASSDPAGWDPSVPHKYTISLPDVTAGAQKDFSIVVYVCNNGTDKAVSTYASPKVTLHTEFDIVDYTGGNERFVGHYTQDVDDDVASITTVTTDRWGVQKSKAEGYPKLSNDGTKAIFAWEVKVGLIDNNGNLITDISRYREHGRDTLDHINLKDTLSTELVIGEGGTSTLDSGTLKISKGNGTPQEFDSGSDIALTGDLALDVAEGEDMVTVNNHGTLAAPPTLTTYTVTAEYPVTDDMIAKFYEKQNSIDSVNKAKVSEYKLDGIDNTFVGNETPNVDEHLTLEVKKPAAFKVDKELREYAAGSILTPYDEESMYGTIKFKITDLTSADHKFTVYKKKATGTPEYEAIQGMTNVESAILTRGEQYYLEPGHEYKIEEVLEGNQSDAMELETTTLLKAGVKVDEFDPDEDATFTPAATDDYKAIFTNKEIRGKIKIEKKDDKGSAVEGAVFELQDANGNPVNKPGTNETYTVTTDRHGKATFKNLQMGTYKVVEKSAPSGYVMDTTPSRTITLTSTSTDADITLKFVNRRNGATLTLTKYVAGSEETYGTADQNFAGTFKLYKRKEGTTAWEGPIEINHKTEFTVNSEGVIELILPPFDADGTPFEYKFVEAIPAGYYDPATGYTTTAETAPVTLTKPNTLNNSSNMVLPDDKDVEMYNRKLVTAHVQKTFYSVGSNGKLAFDKNKTTTATLYRYPGVNTTGPEEFETIVNFGGEGDDGKPKWFDFPNLMLYSGTGNNQVKISYLIKETSVAGYTLDLASLTGEQKTIEGVDYIELAIDTATSESGQPYITAVLNNIEQKVPVKVLKYDYYTEEYVEGSKFTTYGADGTTVVRNENAIPPAGDTFYLTAGAEYTFKETDVPDDYYLHSYRDANKDTVEKEITIDGNKVKYGTIDLSGYVVSYKDFTDKKDLTVERRIYNYQDPLIRIIKKDTAGATVSGAKFTVYKKASDGEYYVRVPGVDEIDSNVDSDVRLEPGEYYVHESTVPDGYVNPDQHPELYEPLGGYVRGHIGSASGNLVTLKKITVDNADGPVALLNGTGTDNVCPFEFKNIKNVGSLKVLKKVYDTLSKDFEIVVLNPDGSVAGRKKTNGNGAAEFTGLPVYDDNGQKIKYTITEELSNTQASQYYQASENQTATLSTTGQTTKDINGNQLVVINHTKIKVDVRKFFRNTWDYTFTHMDYPMEGATIGLFVKEEQGGTVVWKKVGESAKTNSDGFAFFEGLRRDKEYALVELASGDEDYFPYNPDGTTYEDRWKYKYPPAGATSIPDSEIGKYNVSKLTPSMTSDKSKTEFSSKPDLINANHWVQFDITKWLDHDTYKPLEGEEPIYGDEVVKTGDDKDTKYDNAVFDFYRFVMPGETGSINFENSGIYDEDGNEIPWTLVGSYTTGTKYDKNGIRQIGEFMTNVEQNINDHYVYLLVERTAGPNGGEINPKFKYTFWQENDKNYTITVPGSYDARMMYYTMDQVNYDDILNAHPVGPGDGVIYLASIRIAKWQDVLDTTTGQWKKEYTPLPNTEFKVYLKDKTGPVLATLTTGLDATDTDPKAWAQSGTYRLVINANRTYTLIDYETGDEIALSAEDVKQYTAVKDGNTYNGYRIPVVVVETDCPEGYSYDTDGYEMYLCFFDLRNGTAGNSWVFNDAFFVTTAGNKSDGTPYTLATDGTDTAWYITNAENYNALSEGFFLGDDESKRRIVDYPINNTFVTVNKYGYAPNKTTIKGSGTEEDPKPMTSAELDTLQKEAINREGLPGVTMYLQHRNSNGTWEFWDYKTNTATTSADKAKFTTGDGGGYIFPDGLKPGTYRIYETSLPNDAESTIYYSDDTGTQRAKIKDVYEMAYFDSASSHSTDADHPHARVFTVGKDNKSVTMYNPKKVDLTLIKEDLSGNKLPGAKFSLLYSDTAGYKDKVTDATGKVVFRNIDSKKYWLVETMAGYSSEYLQEYLETVDPDLADLAVKPGVDIGNTLDTKGDSSESDTVVSAISPSCLIPESGAADLTLTIKNPKQSNIQIIKVDDNGTTITSKAKFIGYYHPFTQVPKEGGGYEYKDVFSWTQNPPTRAQLEAAHFNPYSYNGSTDLVTASGEIKLTNVDPGIYAFIETEAPDGYDVLTTKDGKEIVYFVVVTGGMTADVSGLTPSVKIWNNDDITTIINGVVVSGVETAAFSAKNFQQVNMKAMKELVNPTGATNDSWKIFKTWKVNLDLYAADKSTKLGSATFNTPTDGEEHAITFSKNGAPVKLSKGKTYYIKETVEEPAAAFKLIKLFKKLATGDWTEVTAEDGFYPVEVTEDGIIVKAQNMFLWGQVKFKKYEDGDFSSPLAGAEFEVRYNKNAGVDGAEPQWVKLPNSSVSYDSSTKTYIADIPLLSETPTTYRIYETKAPANHVLDPEKHLEVKVPQEIDGKLTNVIDYSDSHTQGQYLFNTEGNNLTITKYDNLHDASSHHNAGENAAAFTIYHRTTNPAGWEVVQPETWTDTDGKVTYLTTPGELYAIAETDFADTFLEMDGIYRVVDGVETKLVDTEEIQGDTAYLIRSSSDKKEDIVIHA